MESLVSVVLFTVVVIAWMSLGLHPVVLVRHVRDQPVLMSRDQGLIDTSWRALCSVHATAQAEQYRFAHMQTDRRNDSSRGRPLLHLN